MKGKNYDLTLQMHVAILYQIFVSNTKLLYYTARLQYVLFKLKIFSKKANYRSHCFHSWPAKKRLIDKKNKQY